MKALVGAFNQEKALVGAFSVITNLRMELFQALISIHWVTLRTSSALLPPAAALADLLTEKLLVAVRPPLVTEDACCEELELCILTWTEDVAVRG